MGKVHRSYSSKRKALERIKAKRRERKKEIREPLSRHDKNDALAWFIFPCLLKDTVDVMDEGELQQQQQLINNLGQIEVSQDKRIQDLEKQNSLIRARESKISQDSKKNLQRAFGAEGRIKDLNSQIRSVKYQINSHNCNYVLNKINYKK
ncbi:uncharacterized protein OCT59_009741 [Rhizophagus irregularis]|uniref:Uncharacterized protein n=1 Tax=Rhizophagus irregularis TaxID=588596 RepID=A0A916EEH0_9GLOM|nr:hypothetical protein OCT59_009741 [Rhizophagus irregularis]CAB5381477.1 unnamed protein product [Rhizophagus irregularis]